MSRLKIYDLATASWIYVGGVDPTAVVNDPAFETAFLADAGITAALAARYPPKPSAGVVYGINQYFAALGPNTAILNTPTNLITIAMPSAPAGSFLDLSWMVYINQGVVGTTGTVFSPSVNGVAAPVTCVVDDKISLMSYSGRVSNVAQPVGVAYNIVLIGQKLAAGGTIQAQGTNTILSIVSYRP